MHMQTTVTVTSKRQITIPKKVWDQLAPGRYLDLTIADGVITLQKRDLKTRQEQFWARTRGRVKAPATDAQLKRSLHKHYQTKHP